MTEMSAKTQFIARMGRISRSGGGGTPWTVGKGDRKRLKCANSRPITKVIREECAYRSLFYVQSQQQLHLCRELDPFVLSRTPPGDVSLKLGMNEVFSHPASKEPV
jgi:hypothetical protein